MILREIVDDVLKSELRIVAKNVRRYRHKVRNMNFTLEIYLSCHPQLSSDLFERKCQILQMLYSVHLQYFFKVNYKL